jgi:TetR/AcrR family transcriptional regulator, transcriptional repressor for nem operon
VRVSKAQQARNRERVVGAAARLLRERGIEGIGVDALAEAAGLTHGAVYSHFGGKDDLAAAAVARAFSDSASEWQAAGERGESGTGAFNELVRHYVSRIHRDDPSHGCAMAAIGPDARRHGRKVRRAFSEGAIRSIEIVAAACEGATADQRREQAIAVLAAMVGAIVIARAVEDRELSDRILLTVRRKLMKPR